MRIHILHLILIVSYTGCASGCAWIKPKQNTVVQSTTTNQNNRIVDRIRYEEGGKLFLKSLIPGQDVEANDRTDEINLNVQQGIIDILRGDANRFEVVPSENKAQAELIFEGHLTELYTPSGWTKGVFKRKKARLRIAGRIYDKETGDTIVIFNESREFHHRQESFTDIGFIIGQDIGRFIR